ncbi:hypothetical protein MRX96_037479 [Rhipicephalus microplus]
MFPACQEPVLSGLYAASVTAQVPGLVIPPVDLAVRGAFRRTRAECRVCAAVSVAGVVHHSPPSRPRARASDRQVGPQRSASPPVFSVPPAAASGRPRALPISLRSKLWYERENIRSVGGSGRVSFNVWGAITYAGLGPLFRILGRLTAEVYNEIIDDVLLPFAITGPFPDGCFYFQHDGCLVHNASTVQENINASCMAQLCWPPKSPDLNIVENVWGPMKARLARANLTNNDTDTLWKHVKMEWNSLRQDPDLVKSLFASIPKRLYDVKERSGGVSKY